MQVIYYIFVFVFGTVIGSFLNVLIFRMPRRISIITPQSFCPGCKKRIKWYQNIPLVSYIILGGRCSECRQTISLRYPIVEALTGLLFVFIYYRFGFGYSFFFIGFYFSALLVITFIDFSFQVIPDVLSIPGIFLGLLFQIFRSDFLAGIVGMAFGGGMILLIRIIGGKVYKKEVMGLGDVYLTAMIGAFVGFPFILPAIFIGALFGAAIGLAYIIATRQDREIPIPFGPFLSLGGIAVVIFEPLIYRLFALLGVYI